MIIITLLISNIPLHFSLLTYLTPAGWNLYLARFTNQRDPIAKAKIASRMNRLVLGHLGEHKSYREGAGN